MPIDTDRATGYITVTFLAYYDDETGQYVSRCAELGISSCGADLDQAFENIAEATDVYLETLESVGERERVLTERGITVLPGDPPAAATREMDVRIRTDEYATAHNLRLPAAV